MTERARRCALCGHGPIELLLEAVDRMQARPQTWRYVRCPACGLIAVDPLPAPGADLSARYPPDYHARIAPPERDLGRPLNRWVARHRYAADSAARPRAARAVARALSRWTLRGLLAPHGRCRLLDVGCGCGALLRAQRALGWAVRGIEPDPGAAARCRRDGLEVHAGSAFDAPFGAEHDVVLLSHVIEHAPEPVALLARCAAFLAPGGTMIVRTPNARSLGMALYGPCWYGLDAPRHLFVFDAATLRRAAAAAGLAVRRIATPTAPDVLAHSRACARRQAAPAAAAAAPDRRRRFRDLIAPLAALAAAAGRGEELYAELALPA